MAGLGRKLPSNPISIEQGLRKPTPPTAVQGIADFPDFPLDLARDRSGTVRAATSVATLSSILRPDIRACLGSGAIPASAAR